MRHFSPNPQVPCCGIAPEGAFWLESQLSGIAYHPPYSVEAWRMSRNKNDTNYSPGNLLNEAFC